MDAAAKEAVRRASSWPALRKILRGIEGTALSAREVHLIDRALTRCSHPADLRLAYLSNHTIDPLPRYVRALAAMLGVFLDSYVGGYNQHFQEILDPESGLHGFGPQLIFLKLSLRELAPRVLNGFLELSAAERRAERERISGTIAQWLDLARARTDATLLVANFPPPAFAQAGIADARLEYAESEFYAELNLELLRSLRGDTRAFLFDLNRVVERTGYTSASAPNFYYLAKMQWSEGFKAHIAEELLRYVTALQGHTRKALVVDLDNTLWGGIAGEDGAGSVRVGAGSPEGEAFADFQHAIRSLKQRGVILAVCSKNNFEDAAEVFAKRPEMPLRLGDFSALRINWEPKHENLRSIAAELNIGEDSLVFIDDSPTECALVRQTLPGVHTIQLPGDPSEYAGLLRRSVDFEKLFFTDEDRVKSESYRANAHRAEYQRQVGDLETFLESLETRVGIGAATAEHVARVHQLFTKTNQFNLTTRRYSPADVERFLEEDRWELGVVQVVDRFGSLGIVGVTLVELDEERAVVDSFLMSCRAMGRGVETAIANQLKVDYLLSERCRVLEAEFVPTAKNKPVAGFFEQQGFTVTEELDGGSRRYRLEAERAELLACPGISVHELKEES